MAGAEQEKDQNKRDDLLKQAADQLANLPSPELKYAAYEELKNSGIWTPELEKEVEVADTEFKNIKADPRLKEAQMGALAQLQELGKSGGMDAMDQANIAAARRRAAQESANQQAAVQESMARRGMGGSGLEMVQRQMAGQNVMNQANASDLQIQGEARRRALEAMLKGGSLAGDIRSTDFNEQARVAQAQDELARFKATNAIGQQTRNVANINAANEYGARNTQRVSDANTGIRNTNLDRPNQEKLANYGIAKDKANAAAGVFTTQAGLAGEAAQRTGQDWGGLMQGVGQLGTAYSGYKAGQTGTNLKLAKMTKNERDEFDSLQKG
jgi:hypothetical protein